MDVAPMMPCSTFTGYLTDLVEHQQRIYTLSPVLFLQVYHLPYRLAARYPKTRIGRLATYTDHSRKLDLCDDYVVQSNEFFFDRDPTIFHNIFNFYR